MGSKGLSVIGVTSAGKGPTEGWIKKHGAKYAYGYDTSRALSKFLGVKGIPNAVLVSAAGKVVWQGHPSGLKKEIIAPHLKGAISRPMWEWPKSASSVAKSLKKGSMAKAKKAAETLSQKGDAFGGELVASIDALIEGQVNSIKADFEAGRFLQVQEAAKTAKKSLVGLAAADTIAETVKQMKADMTSKKTIAMQRKLRKLTSEAPRSARDAQKLIAALRKLKARAKGTIAATEAEEAIASLEQLARRSR